MKLRIYEPACAFPHPQPAAFWVQPAQGKAVAVYLLTPAVWAFLLDRMERLSYDVGAGKADRAAFAISHRRLKILQDAVAQAFEPAEIAQVKRVLASGSTPAPKRPDAWWSGWLDFQPLPKTGGGGLLSRQPVRHAGCDSQPSPPYCIRGTPEHKSLPPGLASSGFRIYLENRIRRKLPIPRGLRDMAASIKAAMLLARARSKK
jgi:hypothetical protein